MPLVRRLLVVLALSSPLVAAAQPGGPAVGTITARIVDAETGEGLPSATLALYAATDSAFVTGGAAGLDGAVRIDPVRAGRYIARVSFVGYAPRRRPDVVIAAGQTVDLGTVELSADANLLGEATVEAQREMVEQRADRTVYNVAAQPVTAGGNALETLQTLPSLEVDASGNLSLRGNQNVVVQINGRPVPVRGVFLAALLRQIPASNVERVEVIPNPSARYDPEGMSGIINIVLKENAPDRGLVGGVTVGGGTLPSGEFGANVAWQRGAFDLAATYGFRFDNGYRDGTNTRTRTDTQEILFQDEVNENGQQSHFFNGSADYTLRPGTTLGLNTTLGYRSNDSDALVDYVLNDVAVAERLTDGTESGLNADAALVFRHRFDQGAAQRGTQGGRGGMMMGGPMMGGRGGSGSTGSGDGGHELSAEVRATVNARDDDQLYSQTGILPSETEGVPLQRQGSEETNGEVYGQVDYSRPIGALRFETGAKFTARTVASDLLFESEADGAWTTEPTRSNAFDYDESILAGYVQASRPVGPFEVQAGLRAETASRDFTLRSELPPGLPPVDPAATAFSYQSLFPSAFVTLPLGPGSLVKASYSRRIERPRTFFLNPFPSGSDPLNLRVGNPQLRPEYTDAYELTLQYRYFLTLTPFYRRTTDVIQRSLFVDPETGIQRFTFDNFDSQDSYGSDLTVMAQVGPVRGFASGSVFRQVTSEGDASTGLAADAVSWTARTGIQARLREGTDLQLFGFYRGPQTFGTGSVSGFGFTSIGIAHKFSDRLSLNLRANDPFSTTRFEFRNDSEGLYRVIGVNDPAITQISGTLTWTFGSGPQRARQQMPNDPTGGMSF